MEITCPSGLKGVIREMKVKEQMILTDPKLVRTGRFMTEVVRNCWVRTLDPGPYPWGSNPPTVLPWEQILQADKIFAFKEVRVASFGPKFSWDIVCSEEFCKNHFIWEVELDKLPVVKLDPKYVENVRTGKAFETTIGGRKVKYRFLIGSDDARLLELNRDMGMPAIMATYMSRIVAVEGIDASDLEALKTWIEDLAYSEGIKFQQELEAIDCGVDTIIEIKCNRCENVQRAILPLVQAFFPHLKKTGKQSNEKQTSG